MKRNVTLNSPERFSGRRVIAREKLERAAKDACAKLKARVLAELYKDKEALQTLALVDLPQLKSERQRIENIIKAK